MAFVKIDTGILDSTLWLEPDQRSIFLTALCMCEPWDTDAPVKALNVRDLKDSGFVVPPGWYGFVPAAGIGIVHRARMDRELGLKALEELGQPDKESRSAKFEGRRMVRIDRGFVVLNFIDYRDRDNTAAERMKRLRERKKLMGGT